MEKLNRDACQLIKQIYACDKLAKRSDTWSNRREWIQRM